MSKPILPSISVLPIAIAAFLLPILILEIPLMQFAHGDFVYPVDDTLIHLAIAKNLAFHQTWGVSLHEFESASSSILYPLLLATTLKIFGSQLIIPFLLNAFIALILLVVLQKWLMRQGLSPLAQLLILLGVIFLTPLPVLAIAGMEHTLQFLFTFLFIVQFSDELAGMGNGPAKHPLSWKVYVYAILMVSTRYDGLAIVVVACLLLLINKKWVTSFLLGIVAALPILIFGIIALRHGNYFIPNSVILKSGAPPLTFDGLLEFFTNGMFVKLFFSIVGYNSIATQRLLFLLPMAFLIFYKQLQERKAYQYMLLLLTAMVFIHLCVTGNVHFPRYEAYLIGCSVTLLGLLLAKYGRTLFVNKGDPIFWVTCLTGLFLAFPLVLRSNNAFGEIEKASLDNYLLQYQAGKFMHHYYDSVPVAVEALGAVSYFSDGKKLDILGLGDIDVARGLKNNYYGVEFMQGLCKKDSVGIAIASEFSTDPQLLNKWTKVATWQVPWDWGGYYISFYAIEQGKAADLKKHLQEYQPSLARELAVRYY